MQALIDAVQEILDNRDEDYLDSEDREMLREALDEALKA